MMRLQSVVVVCAVLLSAAGSAFSGDDDFRLAATGDLQWYRGNMHTHSLWSDGDDYPEMIADWYREHGYQFLVCTDHNVLPNRERWIDIERNKGGRAAFDKYVEKFGSEWVQQRTENDRGQVRLRKFDEVFDRMAVPHKFLLVQGEEITDSFKGRPVHLCATNTSELLPPAGGTSLVEVMQRNIDVARSVRERTGIKTLVHLNHPNFHYAVTAEQLMQVAGEQFFEVYNGHPSVNNNGDNLHASTSQMWDIINTWRLSKLNLPIMHGVATDDGHDYHKATPGAGSQPGRGWVVVLANELTPDSLVTALEAGRFYSSSGVHLREVSYADGKLTIVVNPEADATYQIDFIGTRRNFDDTTQTAALVPEQADLVTNRYSNDVGATLKSVHGESADYQFQGDELYVRAVVTSSRPHPNPSQKDDFEQAWIQPVVPAAPAD